MGEPPSGPYSRELWKCVGATTGRPLRSDAKLMCIVPQQWIPKRVRNYRILGPTCRRSQALRTSVTAILRSEGRLQHAAGAELDYRFRGWLT